MVLQVRSFGLIRRIVLTAALAITAAFGVLSALPSHAAQSVPYKVNFQGRLTDNNGNIMPDGSYNIKFRLFDALSAGTNKYQEDRVFAAADNRVAVQNGLFNIQFGDVTAITPALFSGVYPLYLEVELPTPATATCATNGCAVFTEGAMTPRQPMASSPYAISADTLDGLDSSAFAQLNTTNTGSLTVTGALQSATATHSGANALTLGSTTNAASIVFNDGTVNARGVTLASPALTASYSLSLPSTGPGLNQCLISGSSTASQLIFGSCSAGITLQNVYANSTDPEITLSAGTTTGLTIKDAAVAVTGNLLEVKNNAATVTYFGVSSTGISVTGTATVSTQLTTPAVDASSGTLSIGAGTASAITLGKSGVVVSAPGGLTTSNAAINAGTGTLTAGTTTLKNSADSATALTVQNVSGANILGVATNGGNTNNLIANPSIESAIAGNWTFKGSASVVQDNTNSYYGSSSLQITTTALAGDGAKQAVTMVASTTYTLSLYARASSGNMSTFEIGYSNDGSTNTPCLTAQNVIKNGYTRFTCTFTTAGSVATPYIYVSQTDATARSFINIDSVLLQTEANAQTAYREGSLSLQGSITSPLIIQNTTNSSIDFAVLTSKGANVFAVDSTDSNILNGNAGFELSNAGWTYSGTPGSISRTSSFAFTGSYGLKVITSAAAKDGVKFTLANGSPAVPNLSNTTYTLSWFARLDASSAAFTDISAVYTPDGSSANEVNCAGLATSTVVTGGWTRYSCTLPGSAVAPTASANIQLRQVGAAAHTFYIDSVQLELGSTNTGYGAGSLNFNASISSPVAIRNTSDSTSAFQVEKTGGIDLLTADTLNSQVVVGSTVSDATQITLALDQYNNFADSGTCGTSVANGSLYYNTATNAVRGCINGGWEDLVSTSGLGILAFGIVPDSGTNPGDLPALTTTGVTGPCKVSWASSTTVNIAACTAYSGGRKVTVPSTILTLTTTTINLYENVCLTGANNAPALVGPAATQNSATIMPTFSINNPIVCLATIRNGVGGGAVNGSFAVTGGTPGQIYDTRTFTNSVKAFVASSSAMALGTIAQNNGNQITTSSAAAATGAQQGIVIASNGSTSTAAPNVLIATHGPAYVAAIAGTLGQVAQSSTTAGFASTLANPAAIICGAAGTCTANTTVYSPYAFLGFVRTTFSAACTSAATCLGSLYVDLNIR